jgi:hypothetical protein
MKTIQINTSIPLSGKNIGKWRGAIIEQVLEQKKVFQSADVPTNLFHNHDENKWNDPQQKGRYDKLNQYPLVQYLEENGKASLRGIAEGAKALQLWYALAGSTILLNGKKESLEKCQVNQATFDFQFTQELNTYRLDQWIPFTPKKLENWKNAQTLVEKAQLLDKALFGHFLHAAEEWGLNLDKYKLKLNVKNCIKHQVVDCFHQKKLAFDVEISINCLLPIGFGLGQGASINFGRISKLNS